MFYCLAYTSRLSQKRLFRNKWRNQPTEVYLEIATKGIHQYASVVCIGATTAEKLEGISDGVDTDSRPP